MKFPQLLSPVMGPCGSEPCMEVSAGIKMASGEPLRMQMVLRFALFVLFMSPVMGPYGLEQEMV